MTPPGAHDLAPTGQCFHSPALAGVEWLAHDVTIPRPDEWRQAPGRAIRRHPESLALTRSDASTDSIHTEIPCLLGRQTHGDGIATIDADSLPPTPPSLPSPDDDHLIRLPRTDAIILTAPGAIASVATADCVPLIVVDTDGQRVAVVHAGWRGTFYRIVAKTIRRPMALGADPSNLILWTGPCIRARNYPVDRDLARRFAGAFPAATGGVDGRHLDLAAINQWMAREMGVPEPNLLDSSVCTFEDARFPSYRRDGVQAGRMLTRIAIRGRET
jgi:YfiH family protein